MREGQREREIDRETNRKRGREFKGDGAKGKT